MALPGLMYPVQPRSDSRNNNTLHAYSARSLPVVRHLEVVQESTAPSGEPRFSDKTTTEYEYSMRNFMGYGAKTTPAPQDADLTVFAVDDYEYDVKCRVPSYRYDSAQDNIIPFYLTKRDFTFDKFHCLKSQQDTFTDLLRSDDSDAVRSRNVRTQTLQQFVSSADLSGAFSEQLAICAKSWVLRDRHYTDIFRQQESCGLMDRNCLIGSELLP
ncbi:hypothetical protein [Enterobacter hormaechei]|uniref:hypothetical protein n=1 Tax=Enterobacter hormaechei TaxID=158836 RepID=UPI003DA6E694